MKKPARAAFEGRVGRRFSFEDRVPEKVWLALFVGSLIWLFYWFLVLAFWGGLTP